MNNTINIILSTDNNYAHQTGVVLCSIFENNKSFKINTHIIDGGISEKNKDDIEKLTQKYGQVINFTEIDLDKFSFLPEIGHLSRATWYRILIPEIFKDIDKVLYLDSDIIVDAEIIELYNTDIKDKIIAAAKDAQTVENFENKDFNAGVLLINIEKWRENNITDKAIDFISKNRDDFKNKKYPNLDQDVLNIVIEKRFIKELPIEYNFVTANISSIRKPKGVAIFHFAGNLKPWGNSNFIPLKNYFFKYSDITPWKKSMRDNNNNLSKKVKRFIYYCIVINKRFLPKNLKFIAQNIKKRLAIKFY